MTVDSEALSFYTQQSLAGLVNAWGCVRGMVRDAVRAWVELSSPCDGNLPTLLSPVYFIGVMCNPLSRTSAGPRVHHNDGMHQDKHMLPWALVP